MKTTLITITVSLLISTSVFGQTKKATTTKTPAKTTSVAPKTISSKAVTAIPVKETKKEDAPVVAKQESKASNSALPQSSNNSLLSSFTGKKDANKKTKSNLVPQSSFGKGSKYLGGSFSFGSTNATAFALYGEYGVTDYLSVGATVSYAKSSAYTSYYGGGSVNFHLINLLKLTNIDPYIGATAGYSSGKQKGAEESTKIPGTGLTVIAQAGVNYYISPKMIAFLQLSKGVVQGGDFQYGGGLKFGM